MFAKNVFDLRIYTSALDLAQQVDDLVRKIPKYWSIAEAKQVLRSSSSAPSNIAEGFSQRFYIKQFIRYLYIAMGSGDETQNHLDLLMRKKYIDSTEANRLIKEYKHLCVGVVNFVKYLKSAVQYRSD